MSKKNMMNRLNLNDTLALYEDEKYLLSKLYKVLNIERIWWKVSTILSIVSLVLMIASAVVLVLMRLNPAINIAYICLAVIQIYFCSWFGTTIRKEFFNGDVDHRDTVLRCSNIGLLILSYCFSTPAFICFLINFIFVRSHKKEFDALFEKMYRTKEPTDKQKYSVKKFFLGVPSAKRFDDKVVFTEEQKNLINTLYKMVNREHVAWTVATIVCYAMAALIAVIGCAFALATAGSETSMGVAVLITSICVAARLVVLGVVNNSFSNNARWYVNTDYVDHRYTVSRCSKFGLIVAGFFFNSVAMVFIIIERSFVKKHKKEFNEISKSIEDSYDPNAILEVRHLCKNFTLKKNLFGKPTHELVAVNDVSFTLKAGETLGIVGESGCGKTTMGRAILKLHKPSAGQVLFNGRDISRYGARRMRAVHKDMQIIFQDPYSSLPPRSTVGGILSEPVEVHHIVPKAEVKDYVLDLMEKCGLRDYYYERYPHEFSGGQRQRICIARALSVNPSLVVCDEPVSALDVSIQAQIINLLKQLQKDMNLTYLFISHDLSVVKFISDKIGVMYLGTMMEFGSKEDIFSNPLHPYTQALFSAIPQPDPDVKMKRIILKGDIPSPANPPKGCRFHTRCPHAMDICKEVPPEYKDYGGGHCAACHKLG